MPPPSASGFLRGPFAAAQRALRIPSPPPVPTQVALPTGRQAVHRELEPTVEHQYVFRAPSDTNPGLGEPEVAALPAVPEPPPSRRVPPSLLTTQVGLGVVKFDREGRAAMVPRKLPEGRFLVRDGKHPGELVLSPLEEGATLPPGALIVKLAHS